MRLLRRIVGSWKRIRQSIRIDLLAASGCCNRGRRSNLMMAFWGASHACWSLGLLVH
jgi:hypothetical protein